ncbi:uncharacterized protein EV420DRAFT_384397 [Desarmillaria tabescens]|uniref:Aminoglycoside phosphotransferase domain-containing protein n=1 Tax=Armillaria tabescens TaxID=1929756 RepID=A0AA39KBN8_ARMTA|nr:uncharacterized protein EV420DRAFT_384397 [Desarmillaria tabescens]KAK0458189.1 hypothetical protein EV420DRAFT_384397 [Desarmillaria tabescens]
MGLVRGFMDLFDTSGSGYARTKDLNLEALVKRLEGKTQCLCGTLIPAGQTEHYRIYTAAMEIHKKVLVRVYWPTATNARGTVKYPGEMICSEAATLRFLKCKNLSIPVPTPICYDDDLDGRVGGAWIVTSFVKGDILANRIHDLTQTDLQNLRTALEHVYIKILQTTGTEFAAIGSIRDEANPLVHRQCGYTMGSMMFCPSDTTPLLCLEGSGPFSSARDWLLAVMDHRREGNLGDVREQPERHEENRVMVLNAVKEYDRVPLTSLVLEHVNFGPSNILVDPGDPTKIVGILGWAGARVVPFWGLEFFSNEKEWSDCGLVFRHAVMRRFSDGTWYDEDLLAVAWYARKWHLLKDMDGVLPLRYN